MSKPTRSRSSSRSSGSRSATKSQSSSRSASTRRNRSAGSTPPKPIRSRRSIKKPIAKSTKSSRVVRAKSTTRAKSNGRSTKLPRVIVTPALKKVSSSLSSPAPAVRFGRDGRRCENKGRPKGPTRIRTTSDREREEFMRIKKAKERKASKLKSTKSSRVVRAKSTTRAKSNGRSTKLPRVIVTPALKKVSSPLSSPAPVLLRSDGRKFVKRGPTRKMTTSQARSRAATIGIMKASARARRLKATRLLTAQVIAAMKRGKTYKSTRRPIKPTSTYLRLIEEINDIFRNDQDCRTKD